MQLTSQQHTQWAVFLSTDVWVYPLGVTRAQISQGVKGLGVYMSKTSAHDTVQAAAEKVVLAESSHLFEKGGLPGRYVGRIMASRRCRGPDEREASRNEPGLWKYQGLDSWLRHACLRSLPTPPSGSRLWRCRVCLSQVRFGSTMQADSGNPDFGL